MADPLRRRLRHKFLRVASATTAHLPAPLVQGGLRGAAWLTRFSSFEGRTLANLERAYGEELDTAGRRRIAAGVRRHGARLAHEWLQLASLGGVEREAWLAESVRVDDSIEVLQRVLAEGRGALVVTGHLGNWELLAATLRRIGLRGSVVGYEKRRDPSSQWLVDMRRAYGVETLPQHSHPRALVRVLERGEVLGLLCDLEVRRLAGEFVDFFGLPALTMTAPAALARTRETPLVPVRCVLPQEGAPQYVLSVDAPLAYDHALPRQEAMRDLMRRLNDRFEAWIREHPEQWAWHQHRWRTRPGELDARPLGSR